MPIEIGQRFGWLEVVSRAESTARRQARYVCRCRCSREVTVLGYSLSTGMKRTCGSCKTEYRLRGVFTEIDTRGVRTHFVKQ